MKRQLILIIAALITLSLACSFGQTTEAPTTEIATENITDIQDDATTETIDDEPDAIEDEDTTSSENTVNPTVGEVVPLALDTQAMKNLSSYRVSMDWSAGSSNEEIPTEMAIEMEVTLDPPAQRISLSSSEGDMEIIQIENQQWMRFGEEWMQTSVEESDDIESELDSLFIDAEDIMGQVENDGYKYLGQENINGVNTNHYQIEQNKLAALLDLSSDEEIEEGSVDLWIVDERGLPEYITRMIIHAKGNVDEDLDMIQITYDVYDVNAAFTITAPEDVSAGGLPEGIEIYPNATNSTSLGGLVMFESADDLDSVAEFYTEQLSAAGWSKNDGLDMEGMVMDNWEKDGQKLLLTITESDGVTSVMITLEQE